MNRIIEILLLFFIPTGSMIFVYNQISKERFKKIFFLGVLFLFVIHMYLNEIMLLILLFFGFYYYGKKICQKKHSLALFLSVYSILWTMLLSDAFQLFFMLTVEDFTTRYSNLIHYIGFLLVVLINFSTIELFDLEVDILKKNDEFIETKIIDPMNRVMAFSFLMYLLVIISFEYVSNQFSYAMASLIFVFFQILLYFIFIGLLSTKIKAYLYVQIEREKDQRYKQLEQYTDDIEGMQKEIAGFKHDIKNIWISFSEIIRSEDIALIESEFNEIKKALKVKLVNTDTASHDLSNLQNGVVKGLLHQKAILAKQQGISIQIDIQNVINQICMDKLDFVRVLGILLDNAIEEAVESKKKNLVVGIVCEEKHIITEIINSTDRKHIPINNIFKYGYSTKEGEDRGKGLAVVSDIIEETSNVELKTECSNNSFSQSLKIWNENENKYFRR